MQCEHSAVLPLHEVHEQLEGVQRQHLVSVAGLLAPLEVHRQRSAVLQHSGAYRMLHCGPGGAFEGQRRHRVVE